MSSPSLQLLAEIAFWREMLEAEDTVRNDSARERMRHALALAEWKLLMLEQAVAESESSHGDWSDPALISKQAH